MVRFPSTPKLTGANPRGRALSKGASKAQTGAAITVLRPLSRHVDNFGQDLEHAARGLRKSPGFAAAVIVTLALGIGANAAMFGVVDRLMYRPYPYMKDPSSVHRVYVRLTVRGTTRIQADGIPYTRYVDIKNSTSSFTHQAAFVTG